MLESLKLGRSKIWTTEMREKLRQTAISRELYKLGNKATTGMKRPDNAPRLKRLWASGKLKGYWKGKERPEMRGEKNKAWNGGSSFTYYRKYGVEMEKIKTEVIARDKVCRLCGELKKNMALHHIDYDRQHNTTDNLIFLCNNCHSKTNFSRQEWIDKFKKVLCE
jgi:hypothetical protein